MRQKITDSDYLSLGALPVYGIAFDPGVGTWSAFNEETRTILSEHKTEAQAHTACRRYEGAAFRRLRCATVLAGLSRRAV